MRRKNILRVLLVILVLSALIPTVYAYMFHKSQTISNPFVPAKVSCKTRETFVNFEEKTEITVENIHHAIRLVQRVKDHA